MNFFYLSYLVSMASCRLWGENRATNISVQSSDNLSEFFTVHLKNLLSITTLTNMASAQTFSELIH